jgi:hypothetical protein
LTVASSFWDSSILAFSAAHNAMVRSALYFGLALKSSGRLNLSSSHGLTTLSNSTRSKSRPPHMAMPPWACSVTRPEMLSAIAMSSVPPPKS